ncbi:MAG: aminoacetone oxidase family FAD-binding enzyme [Ruminococcus sp.]|nr:aminoacetone oxidase family FAD-binding enzyme [Ruminococcus sp.]
MQKVQADIAIIGGGASGLAAAIEAKRYGGAACHTIVLEKNARLGKKILATGNGRCNLGHVEEKERRYYTGSCAALAEQLFSEFEGSESFFRSLGVICKADSGRLYPYSNHAASVLDALRFHMQELGAESYTESEVTALDYDKKSGLWKLTAGEIEISAKAVIVACGGKAAPAFGTDGSFFRQLKFLGHTHTQLTPALCAVYTDAERLKGLKGIRTLGRATLFGPKGERIASDKGEIQLTDQALSGICIFNLASLATEYGMTIQLDLLPHLNEYEVTELLWGLYAERSGWAIEDMLTGVFQKKLGQALLRSAGINLPFETPVYSLSPLDMEKLIRTIGAWTFPVRGLSPWSAAQVTSGGIPRAEIDENLQSVLCPGLYFAGEVLDLAGECGGFNLAWAWCSGIHAAHSAIDAIEGGTQND